MVGVMSIIDSKYIEIRCDKERPHKGYSRCGSLLGGVDPSIQHTTIQRCPTCNVFWLIMVSDDGTIVKRKLKEGERILFKKHWRIVQDADKVNG